MRVVIVVRPDGPYRYGTEAIAYDLRFVADRIEEGYEQGVLDNGHWILRLEDHDD